MKLKRAMTRQHDNDRDDNNNKTMQTDRLNSKAQSVQAKFGFLNTVREKPKKKDRRDKKMG